MAMLRDSSYIESEAQRPKFDIPTVISPRIEVTVPDVITIPLVRADDVSMNNTFRTAFEIALAFLGIAIGAIGNAPARTLIHWLLLFQSGFFFVLFLALYLWFSHRTRTRSQASNNSAVNDHDLQQM